VDAFYAVIWLAIIVVGFLALLAVADAAVRFVARIIRWLYW